MLFQFLIIHPSVKNTKKIVTSVQVHDRFDLGSRQTHRLDFVLFRGYVCPGSTVLLALHNHSSVQTVYVATAAISNYGDGRQKAFGSNEASASITHNEFTAHTTLSATERAAAPCFVDVGNAACTIQPYWRLLWGLAEGSQRGPIMHRWCGLSSSVPCLRPTPEAKKRKKP